MKWENYSSVASESQTAFNEKTVLQLIVVVLGKFVGRVCSVIHSILTKRWWWLEIDMLRTLLFFLLFFGKMQSNLIWVTSKLALYVIASSDWKVGMWYWIVMGQCAVTIPNNLQIVYIGLHVPQMWRKKVRSLGLMKMKKFGSDAFFHGFLSGFKQFLCWKLMLIEAFCKDWKRKFCKNIVILWSG